MKKFYIFILIQIFILCHFTNSYAKYIPNCSAKLFHIDYFDEDPSVNKPATISGKITTENMYGIHKSLVTLYKTSDTSHTQPISQIETNEDGTFSFTVTDITLYDIVVSKIGYLNYTVLEIKLRSGRTIILPDYKLIVGDFVPTGKIDIQDWIQMLIQQDEAMNSSNAHFDVNGDGIINKTDSDIVKGNYLKVAETVIWSK